MHSLHSHHKGCVCAAQPFIVGCRLTFPFLAVVALQQQQFFISLCRCCSPTTANFFLFQHSVTAPLSYHCCCCCSYPTTATFCMPLRWVSVNEHELDGFIGVVACRQHQKHHRISVHEQVCVCVFARLFVNREDGTTYGRV